jgi:dihydroneopterin aldolase
MPDLIRLKNLVVAGHHGANPGEKDTAQDFVLNIEFEIDLEKPGNSDALEDTVNYSRVNKLVMRIITETSYNLLERIAADIVHAIFEDRRIRSVQVAIAKPNILAGCTPEVVLRRSNPNYSACEND